MSAASERALADLHSQLAKSMTKSLQQTEIAELLLVEYRDELPKRVVKFLEDASTASPALLAAISKFLKDNEITCQPDEDEGMSVLEQTLKNKRRKVSDIDLMDETIQ